LILLSIGVSYTQREKKCSSQIFVPFIKCLIPSPLSDKTLPLLLEQFLEGEEIIWLEYRTGFKFWLHPFLAVYQQWRAGNFA
jgi:hypothetical protein